ncbi:hypothetical protein SDC9_147991 [bioreactor metagenome]|uniref:Uncharacterized protein n=1 Tax=bioreactor metagenome TaxID=1076179 RepID=A0A645EJQ7_9ZZZZ
MRRLAVHAAAVHVDALVRHHHLHAGGLAHHAAIKLGAAQPQGVEHHRRADAAHFLVIRQRQMQRLGARHGQVFGHQGQRRGDEALHVATAAPI